MKTPNRQQQRYGMKKKLIILLSLLIVIIQYTYAEKQEYVFFISLDGFHYKYIPYFKPPNISKLVENGVWFTNAKGFMPAITRVNQSSLITGCYPRSTGLGGAGLFFDENLKVVIEKPLCKAKTVTEILKGNIKTPVRIGGISLIVEKGAMVQE